MFGYYGHSDASNESNMSYMAQGYRTTLIMFFVFSAFLQSYNVIGATFDANGTIMFILDTISFVITLGLLLVTYKSSPLGLKIGGALSLLSNIGSTIVYIVIADSMIDDIIKSYPVTQKPVDRSLEARFYYTTLVISFILGMAPVYFAFKFASVLNQSRKTASV